MNDYKEYLDRFLTEGEKYNGINIWLANLIQNHEIIYAHNQRHIDNFTVLDQEEIYAFGNGR